MAERLSFGLAVGHEVERVMSLITTEAHVDGHISELFEEWIDDLLGGFHLELKLSKDMFQVLQLARVA